MITLLKTHAYNCHYTEYIPDDTVFASINFSFNIRR